MTPFNSFPQQLSATPTQVLLDVYDQAAPRLAQAVTGLSADDLWSRARGRNKWSIGEIVCHLADSEIVAAVRFRLVRSAPDTPMVVYDQDAFADQFGYRERDERGVDVAIAAFAAMRRSTGALLRSLGTPDWDLAGLHPEWGTLTLRQLLEMYAEHGERHLDQILDLRNRLGKPIPLASILAHRLDRDVPATAGVSTGGEA